MCLHYVEYIMFQCCSKFSLASVSNVYHSLAKFRTQFLVHRKFLDKLKEYMHVLLHYFLLCGAHSSLHDVLNVTSPCETMLML
jgi:hypothetical protein